MQTNISTPIIRSILDSDLYKFNMGCLVFHAFPDAKVTYEFINRGRTSFPKNFAHALRRQIEFMAALALTEDEQKWFKTIDYIRPTYVEWLASYRFNPAEVEVIQTGDFLAVRITGPWYRTIYWEVPLMSIISELYFKMTGQGIATDWQNRIVHKAKTLSKNGCHWIDFGSRRRYTYATQDAVVSVMRPFHGFLGTSNPHLAHKYGVTPQGTYAHEGVQAMMALYGVRMAGKMWNKHWAEHFNGNLGITLTDTFTTPVFLRDFSAYEAKLFDGARQDSGDPMAWGHTMLNHYKKLSILTQNKRFVFSNNLNVENYMVLDKHFRNWAQPVGGIGTSLTNDVGVKPLNIVIKMVSADFGLGVVDVVKLSDDTSKHTGKPEVIEAVKRELNLAL